MKAKGMVVVLSLTRSIGFPTNLAFLTLPDTSASVYTFIHFEGFNSCNSDKNTLKKMHLFEKKYSYEGKYSSDRLHKTVASGINHPILRTKLFFKYYFSKRYMTINR